jgi:hypothetical protein
VKAQRASADSHEGRRGRLGIAAALCCAGALTLMACSKPPEESASYHTYAASSSQGSDDEAKSDGAKADTEASADSDTPYQDAHGDEGCTEDCSGHDAGYRWARDNNITDEADCTGDSDSFIEGCEAYVQDHEGEDHSDDQ